MCYSLVDNLKIHTLKCYFLSKLNGVGNYTGKQTVSFTIHKALNVITATNIKKLYLQKQESYLLGRKIWYMQIHPINPIINL